MAKRGRILTTLFSAIGMFVLILDSRTAIAGAAEGIEICVRAVLPSLLPFFVLSILLTNTVAGMNIPLLSPVRRFCGIPKGAESLLLIGLLGGYPVGAQSVKEAYCNGCLTKKDAHRLLGFCSNAGPAFIFGIAGNLFSSQKTVFLLWGIHILSALIVGTLLPGKSNAQCRISASKETTLPAALTKALRVMAGVCGWIILFRIVIAFLDRWFLWIVPETIRLLLVGLLELANGCHCLIQTPSEAVRLILGAVILGFGGICVSMQTISVTGELGTGWYFPGKLLQGTVSLILSTLSALFLYNVQNRMVLVLLICTAVILSLFILLLCKKTVAFYKKRVYNN